jgi:predicted enzyme related to lactoylglutathione lyase
MFKCTSLLLSSGNYQELNKFYEAVFKKPADPMMGWQVGQIYIVVMEHSEIHGKSKEGPRLMINLETEDVRTEFERIKNIAGASVIKEPYQMTMDGKIVPKEEEQENGFWIATIADPDGNYFQLMSPWNPPDQSK